MMNWDKTRSVQHLRMHAASHEDVVKHKAKTGHCARFVREAIEAGGLTLLRHPSAKDYGTSLVRVGFIVLHTRGVYFAGDVVIIRPVEGHPHGHIAMYDGRTWISDFVQRDIWPGSAYRNAKPSFTVYRYGLIGDTPLHSGGTAFV